MKSPISFVLLPLGVLLAQSGCSRAPAGATSTFLDVHEFGPGKVTAADVAKAHQADLAAQGRHDVRFLEYWVDEEHGRVYCLSQARDAASVVATHREAHGLLPARIDPVSGGAPVLPSHDGTRRLFVDVHEFGPGKVTAADVAAAHEKDLAAQSQFGVRFLNYWVDEAKGQVVCLSEAPSAEAVTATHRAAHGLLPASIAPVMRGQ